MAEPVLGIVGRRRELGGVDGTSPPLSLLWSLSASAREICHSQRNNPIRKNGPHVKRLATKHLPLLLEASAMECLCKEEACNGRSESPYSGSGGLVPRGHAQGDGCLGPLLTTDTATDVRAESLTGFTFLELHARMSVVAPTLVQFMDSLPRRRSSPVLMYQNNWSNNRLQKTFMQATRVAFQPLGSPQQYIPSVAGGFAPETARRADLGGLTAKDFDVLHALGLAMSHLWTSKAIRRMSRMTRDERRELVRKYPWVLTYDSVVILFKIFSQRLENLQKLTSGTAATAYLKPGATPLPASANQEL
ncbi:hypothetical protein R3P38DRAFT_3222781 [Favolaschia claudopus]|uniref:Uncharacterized protein n=1 Tax=Favolaschia claudopus TaxID=2862362 RepID=A0AAV9ZYG8_9AGAR